MKNKIKTFFELIRIKNCLMAGIASIIGALLATNVLNLNFVLIFSSIFFICAAGQSINDYFDYKIDSKINKTKPLPSKRVTKFEVLELSFFMFILGIAISYFISYNSFLIAVIFSGLLLIYAGILYKVKYIGNFVVALGTSFTFIYGAISVNNLTHLIIIFATSAFFANLAREIIKDFQDLKKDKGFKKTLPMISTKISEISIVVYYLIAIIMGISAAIIFNLNIFYLIFLLLSIIVLIISTIFLFKKDFLKSQKFSKIAMIIMLLAYISSIIGVIK
jgi:geranylgeranylglycerol-phosphate geranylgeranyltransferase